MHVLATDGLRRADDARGSPSQRARRVARRFLPHGRRRGRLRPPSSTSRRGANATMVVVGVSRHGRLRRSRSRERRSTGSPELAGSDRRAPGHPRGGRRPGSAALGRCRRSAPDGSSRGWVAGPRRPGRAHRACSPGCTTRTSCRSSVLLFLAGTVLVALVGGLLPALVSRGRRLPAAQLVLHRHRSGASPSPSRTTSWPCWCSSPWPSASPRSSTAPPGEGRRRRGPGRRRRPWRPSRSRCSRARTPPRRSSTGCTSRSGCDAVSLLAKKDGAWDGAGLAGDRRARDARSRRDTRVAVDDARVLALCGGPLQASDQRVLEAFAVQTGLVLEYRRLRERETRARCWSAPTRRARRCCARSPTTCGRRWRPCAPRSTGSRRVTRHWTPTTGWSSCRQPRPPSTSSSG